MTFNCPIVVQDQKTSSGNTLIAFRPLAGGSVQNRQPTIGPLVKLRPAGPSQAECAQTEPTNLPPRVV
jgi:hypothetical protein